MGCIHMSLKAISSVIYKTHKIKQRIIRQSHGTVIFYTIIYANYKLKLFYHSSLAGLLVVHRLSRWPDINPAFGGRLVYVWLSWLRTAKLPASMAHSYRLGLVTWRYQVRIMVGPDIYHRGPDICHRGCAYTYTVLQTVQRHGVYSAAYGTQPVRYKEPLKSFEIIVGHSPGFGLSFVAILP